MNSVICLFLVLLYRVSCYEGNYALYFDGINDFVKVGNVATDYELLEFWTFEAWIKPDGPQHQFQPNILGFPWRHPNLELCGNSSNPDCNNQLMPLTQLREMSGGYVTITSKNRLDPLDEDGWYHVAGSWDNTSLSLYVNGALETRINPYTQKGFIDNFKCQFPHCEEGLQIGGYRVQVENGFYNNQHFKGAIDEVRVWKIGRTQEQIQSTMNKTLTGTETNLLYYWRFDEGSGLLAKSYLMNAFGTLGGGIKIAEPKWIESNCPVKLANSKDTTKQGEVNIETSSGSTWGSLVAGALVALISFILGLIIGYVLISKKMVKVDYGIMKDDNL
jgi:hypothetical protein